ncbi:MAG TPA: cyanophycinase [Flavobacterium sp.]|jgi:cyanophycinase
MKIKGKLVIIGGAEDKGDPDSKNGTDPYDYTKSGILARIIKEAKHNGNSRIEIIPTASTIPEEIGQDYITAFKKLKAENVDILDIRTREDAGDPKILTRLEEADVVFFTGGSQIRITSIIGGSPFFDLMLKKLETDPDFIYAGTSAGAAAASPNMIMEGSSTDALKKGEVKISAGLGLIDDVVFDTHFVKRGRIGRLFQVILTNPTVLGIGLEENTGLLFTNNNTKMEAIGPGMAIIIDGRFIRNSNLLEIKEGVPLSIDNLSLQVMSKTDIYDLQTRQMTIITPDDCKI